MEDGRTFLAPLLGAEETTAVWAINHAWVRKSEDMSRRKASDTEMKHKRLHPMLLPEMYLASDTESRHRNSL